MEFGHIVVWIDQTEAHIVYFNRERCAFRQIKGATRHMKQGSEAKSNSPEHMHYFDDVADSLIGAKEILIAGPGLVKLAFIKQLINRHPEIAKKIVGVEVVDHPSEAQLLAYARKYFHRADQLL